MITTITESAFKVTISGVNPTVTSIGTQGPAGASTTAFESGTTTLLSTGRAVTFTTERDDTNFIILLERQALSGEERFGSLSIGEYSIEDKATTGFTIKSPSYMDGDTIRWAGISYDT